MSCIFIFKKRHSWCIHLYDYFRNLIAFLKLYFTFSILRKYHLFDVNKALEGDFLPVFCDCNSMYTIKQCKSVLDKHVMTCRKNLSKLVLGKKKKSISGQNGWNWSKEAINDRSSTVWLSEEKICGMKMFSFVFCTRHIHRIILPLYQ